MLQFILGPKFLPCKAMEYLNHLLLEAVFGTEKRILISWPPRHGKSVLCSHALPVWYLGLFPNRRVMLGSYEASFAEKWGRLTRDTLEKYGRGMFGVRVRQDVFSASRWEIDKYAGGMDTAGTGGSFMGKGGDFIIIDDPVKNAEEALSQTYREKAWEWFDSTVMSRKEPNAAVIVIMQRWHLDDLIGRILRENPGTWKEVRFPALAEETDIIGREPGEALFPARYSRENLLEEKRTKSPYFWNAQYQQRPSPESGTIFLRECFQYYVRAPDKFDKVIFSWDMTFKDKKDSDFVAGHAWGKAGANFYLLDRIHGRMGITATIQGVRQLKAKNPRGRAILIEDKANGTAVIELLKKEIPGIIPVEPAGGKWARANAIEPYQRAGNIYFPDPTIAPWVKDVVEECANFPTGQHDDDVDAMTQAIIYLSQSPSFGLFTFG